VTTPCETYGHSYHSAGNYSFARDEKGKAFRGGQEWHGAAKFTILVCGKCGDTIERQIGPPLEDRAQKISKPQADAAKA
jgi:hypothetical protein